MDYTVCVRVCDQMFFLNEVLKYCPVEQDISPHLISHVGLNTKSFGQSSDKTLE